MKALNEYDTPATRKHDNLRYRSDALFAHAQDMERRFLLCRDAIEAALAWEHKCNNDFDDAPSKESCAFMHKLEEVLEATKP